MLPVVGASKLPLQRHVVKLTRRNSNNYPIQGLQDSGILIYQNNLAHQNPPNIIVDIS